MRRRRLGTVMVLPVAAWVRADPIEMNLRSRDAATGPVRITPTKIDPARLGVMVIDMWNRHSCKTATDAGDGMAPFDLGPNTTLAAPAGGPVQRIVIAPHGLLPRMAPGEGYTGVAAAATPCYAPCMLSNGACRSASLAGV